MIRKSELNKKAIKLRRKGVSYSAILEKVPVAKSTLAIWFKEVKLSIPQTQRITQKRIEARKRGWEAVRTQRIIKTKKIKKDAQNEVLSLINDPLWLSGVTLYWAEGSKEKTWRTGEMIHFSNMDPEVHRIFIKWATKYLCSKKDLYYELYIHKNSDTDKALKFWCQQFHINKSLLKVYFKKNNGNQFRKNNTSNYYGLLRIGIRKSVDLNRKISGWIKGVVECL